MNNGGNRRGCGTLARARFLGLGLASLAACTDGGTATPADTSGGADPGDEVASTGGDLDEEASASGAAEATAEEGGGSAGDTVGEPPDGDDGSDSDTVGDGPPGVYEGYGAMTMGAESCPETPEEVHVTTLADAGPGSLREALSAGCRHILFDVGGTITLAADLNVPYSYVTIDGASAPAPGVTIEQPGDVGTTVEASGSVGPVHDIIISHLRMDGMAGGQHDNAGDIWGLDGEKALVSNIIIDHVTASASTDGIFDVWEGVADVTISWCLLRDTITMMHLSGSDLVVPRERISIHHNVMATNNERQIRARHNSLDIDYRNNVVYGWGWFEGGAAGLHLAYDAGEDNPTANIVGNAFVFVPGLNGDPDDAIKFEQGGDVGQVFFADNLVPDGESDDVSTGTELAVPAWAAVTQSDAAMLGRTVVPHVGTHYPTDVEVALLAEVQAALP